EQLMAASVADILNIEGIGDIIAESVESFFENEDAKALIRALKDRGINITYLQADEAVNEEAKETFSEQTIVLTGSLKHFTRKELTAQLELLGANVTGSVSGNTDLLVAGENAGSKLTRAQELEVTIWDEEELMNHLGSDQESEEG
ncbi:BRCT domain-containing protein, partial [Salmonella enterica]|uniref:BRCT domain-containing protein n=1 Tax=Salmonella enterica TaxID=28901 RepID=UPI002351E346